MIQNRFWVQSMISLMVARSGERSMSSERQKEIGLWWIGKSVNTFRWHLQMVKHIKKILFPPILISVARIFYTGTLSHYGIFVVSILLRKEFLILNLTNLLLTIDRLVSSGWLTIFNLANPSGGEMSSRKLMILMDGVMSNIRQHRRSWKLFMNL